MTNAIPNLELLLYFARSAVEQDEEIKKKLHAKLKTKRAVCPQYDISVFSQIWGTKETAFDLPEQGYFGIPEPALTKDYTTVIREIESDTFFIFFGNRLGYRLSSPTPEFFRDLDRKCLVKQSEAKKRYEK